MSFLGDDPEPRCGWKWLSLPRKHPFTPACRLHDLDYIAKDKPLDVVDLKFYERCKLIAKNLKDKNLERLAEVCYRIVKLWGRFRYTQGAGRPLTDEDIERK